MKAIRDFFKRYDLMMNGRSKELRLSKEEATELASAIGQLMAKKMDKDAAEEDDEIVIDGGGFD